MERSLAPSETRTIPVRAGEQIPVAAVLAYLKPRLPELPDGPVTLQQFSAGASNLTYLLQVGDFAAVLRRAPLGQLPPRAHDMMREAAILSRLHPQFPLAPKPMLICQDSSVCGSPFYLMEYRPGVVLDEQFPAATAVTENLCASVSASVIDTLAQLHAVDWRQAGLAEFGHPDGFLERQLRGWVERYERARTADVPPLDELAATLAAHIPASPAATVIHNDFKLNNIVFSAADLARPVAVVDWEMTTIGDPLLDLAITLGYWVLPQDPAPLRGLLPTVTNQPGFLSRDQMARRYAQRTGRDVSAIAWYLAFAWMKLAVILQQIYVRWRRGQTQDGRFAEFGQRVTQLLAHTQRYVEEAGL